MFWAKVIKKEKKKKSKISIRNRPEEMPLSFWLLSFPTALGPHPLIQGFTHL